MFSRSEQIETLAAALANAQGAFPEIPRNREVEVLTKAGGMYKFRYATLDAILSHVRKPLAENGLSVTQLIDTANGIRLKTVLLHNSGQWIMSEVPIPSSGTPPAEFGSMLSYMRRYALSSILNIASQDDEDGNIAAGTQFETTDLPTSKSHHVAEESFERSDVPNLATKKSLGRAKRVAEEPFERRDVPNMATKKQVDFASALAKKLDWPPDKLRVFLQARYNISSLQEMTKDVASEVIQSLQAALLDRDMAEDAAADDEESA